MDSHTDSLAESPKPYRNRNRYLYILYLLCSLSYGCPVDTFLLSFWSSPNYSVKIKIFLLTWCKAVLSYARKKAKEVHGIDRLSDANGRDIVFKRCICEYGTQPQIDMCIEEMSELTKVLLKYRRKFALTRGENVNPTNGDTDLFKARIDIIDELADVRIMCRQMELLFQAEDEVERRIDFKVDRQIKRLEGK